MVLDWRPRGWSLEKDIAIIIRAENGAEADTSPAACKAWARAFLKEEFPGWAPGRRFDIFAAGAAFNRRLEAADASTKDRYKVKRHRR